MASIKQQLLDLVIDFIANRKSKSLQKAFVKNDKFVDAIKGLDASYARMEKMIDDYCAKYPETCNPSAIERRARK